MKKPSEITLRAVCKPDECALTTERWGRMLSLPLTRLALRLGLSANTVTVLAGMSWMLSLVLVPLGGWMFPGGMMFRAWGLLLAGGFLWNTGYLLDLVDGNISRFKKTACPSGFFLDYVFHLLFKPAFLLSIGVALYFIHGHGLFLLLGILTVPANWNPAESSLEHVVCQLMGKGGVNLDRLTPAARETVLLGATPIQKSVGEKTTSLRRKWTTLLQELLSYYGQFSFFSGLILLDLVIALAGRPHSMLLPVSTITWSLLSLAMIVRVPFRIRREYRRARILDGEAA